MAPNRTSQRRGRNSQPSGSQVPPTDSNINPVEQVDVKPIITTPREAIDLNMMDVSFSKPVELTSTVPHRQPSRHRSKDLNSSEYITAPNGGNDEPTAPQNLSLLGARARVLVHAIRDLAAYGIDTTIPLPKIVVVGDQSAGKSSLIEGISEITVPRDAGTCTRAPLEINLEPTEHMPWRCHVKLVKKYGYAGSRLPKEDANGVKYPFRPWLEESSQTTIDFDVVHDKALLEDVLRRAQIAVLNPNKDAREFRTGDIDRHSTMAQFSPNLIQLNITGDDLPTLTLYDLPGVIAQSQSGGDEHLVKLVKNLVKHYIQQDNTLILAAIPMDQDVQNSQASSIIRKLDLTNRCVGVITKPDRAVTDQQSEDWREILRGNKFAFGHGYFVTRQPSQQQLRDGITHAQAREAEMAFFNSDAWADRFPGTHQQVGTSNLADNLSKMLVELIVKCLPHIRTQVFTRDIEIDMQLEQLPTPPANAVQEVHERVNAFNARMSQRLRGGEGNECKDLFNDWRGLREAFKAQVLGLRPSLFVSDASNQNAKSSKNNQQKKHESPKKREWTDLRSSDSDIDESPSKRPRTHLQPTRMATPMAIRSKGRMNTEPHVTKRSFTLNEIRDILEDFNQDDLPGAISRGAVHQMILETLTDWHRPVETLLAELGPVVENVLLQRTLDETTGVWRTTALYREMSEISQQFATERLNVERKHLDLALSLERCKPKTMDKENRAMRIKTERAEIEKKRYLERVKVYTHKQDGQGQALLDKMQGLDTDSPSLLDLKEKLERRIKANAENKDVKAVLGDDPFEQEIQVFAEVRAYYDLAASRFIDNICNFIDSQLFPNLQSGMLSQLKEKLGLNLAEDQCKEKCLRLLEDDEGRAKKRRELLEQKQRLNQAKARLRSVNEDAEEGV